MFTRMIGRSQAHSTAPGRLCASLLGPLVVGLQLCQAPCGWAMSDRPRLVASARSVRLALDKPGLLGQKSTATQNAREITKLELGKGIGNEISDTQAQSYLINLSAGQFASVVIQQQGIDVIESLFAPDGKLVAEFDSEVRPQGLDTVDFVADAGGLYRLDITARSKGTAGRYEIQLMAVRAATEPDRLLQEAHALSTEASHFNVAGKYDRALSLAVTALVAAEKSLGADHAYVGYLLSELGLIQRTTGDYTKAEATLQRALSISEKALGPEHPQTVDTLGRLGLVYESKSDFGKAARMFQKALDITERILGPEHPRVAQCLVHLSLVHLDLADFEQAERESRRALTISEKTLGLDHRLTAQILNNLGNLSLGKKDYERSEPFLLRALAIYEKVYGPEHPYLIAPLLNLGRLNREKRDYARSLDLYRRALAIAEKTLGSESLDVAALLNNIANVYKSEGDYEKPLALYQRVLGIAEKSLGPYQFLTILSLGNIANLYVARGDATNALPFQLRVDERIEAALALNLAIGSERQKLAYFRSLAERTDRTISFHVNLAPNDRTASALATLVLLQRKGRILDAVSDSLTAIRQRSSAEDQQLLDLWNSTTAQLATLALDGSQQLGHDEYQKQLRKLEEQKERLEEEVSQRSAAFRANSQPVTLSAVQAAIPRSAALVEFAIYRPFNPRAPSNNDAYGKRRYVAYVIRSEGDVQWKELGEAEAIDAAADQLRQALRDPQRSDVQRLAREVDEKVMQPVRALTGDATQLLISPEGELNLIPFAALRDEDGRYLIQRYSFTYLTSGRDLLRLQVPREAKSKPLIVANPSFGEPAAELLATTKTPGPGARRRNVTTGRDLSVVYFAPLSGTAQEASSIQILFPDASVLSAAQATESAVKQVNAPSVLHLATHGFFLSEPGTPANGALAQRGVRGLNSNAVSVIPEAGSGSQAPMETRGINASARIGNPLLRSGLALARANLHNSGNDDGILTALEAAGLNLWGTKLVVLSACDTGVGEVRNGEGVYGLRRAFVLAGAESLVMSLWPISDYSTRSLMTSYYQNLKQGAGRGAALRTVQLEMLKRNPQLHPFYWANFIQYGEWANLAGKR